MQYLVSHGHDDNDKNVSLADDDDGAMILLKCLMVQKAVQYEYIAKLKCLSFNISTEEGDYHVATEVDTEKEKKKRKGKSGITRARCLRDAVKNVLAEFVR